MKKIILSLFSIALTLSLNAQTVDELKEIQKEKKAYIDDLKAQIEAAESELKGIQKEIDVISGWKKGFAGLVGFDVNNSNGWVANPNPDASSSALNVGINAFANKAGEKYFLNNKLVFTKSWQDVDLESEGNMDEEDGLFDNGTVDILNFKSLYGYKLTKTMAVSAMADLNTSLENFLDPGVIDIGAGATWFPSDAFTLVVHPLNYHFAFSGTEGVSMESVFGAKIRADFNQTFTLAGKNFTYSSTLMSFVPYESKDPSLFEYTWLNSINFEVWKGIGVGFAFGIRNAEFESEDTQSYTSFGLSYSF